MKLSSLLTAAACLTALNLPSFAQDAPDFKGPGPGDESAEMIPPPPQIGAELNELAFVPDEAMEMSAFPLSASASGGNRLNFSEEQLEKIYNLKNKLADESGPNHVELMKQKRHLKDLLTKPNLDRSAIQATQDKINKLSNELSNARLAFKMDMFEQLTPEQKQSIRYKSMKRGHGGFKHHGAKGGPGRMQKNSR